MSFDHLNDLDRTITFLHRQRHYLLIKRARQDYNTQEELDEIDNKITNVNNLLSNDARRVRDRVIGAVRYVR